MRSELKAALTIGIIAAVCAGVALADKTTPMPPTVKAITLPADLSTATGTLTDAQVSDTLTCSNFVGSGSLTNAVDLATSEVSGQLADANVSDTLTCSLFVGSGSTTGAVDLATAEVAGTLPIANVNTSTLATLAGANTFAAEQRFSGPTKFDALAVTYGATTNVDFSLQSVQSIALTGDLTVTTTNLTAGRSLTLILTNAASTRNLAFPAWVWTSDTPTTMTAGQTIDCSLYSVGTTDAAVHAACGAGAFKPNLANASGVCPVANGCTNSSTALSGTSVIVSDGTRIVQGPTASIFVARTIKTSGVSFTTGSTTHGANITACGGGGGGGGTKTEGASTDAGAAGGGSGSCSAKRYVSLTPSTAYTIAIGAAGTAGDTTPSSGGTGGNTTFSDGSTTITGSGGIGGAGSDASNNQAVSLGGASGAADASGDTSTGMSGASGMRSTLTTSTLGANGGSCPFGIGGAARVTQGAGNDATGRCSGGGGAVTLTTGISQSGGAGTAGVLVIDEYE